MAGGHVIGWAINLPIFVLLAGCGLLAFVFGVVALRELAFTLISDCKTMLNLFIFL